MKFTPLIYKTVFFCVVALTLTLPGMLMPITVRYAQWEYCPDTGSNPVKNGYGRKLKIRTNSACKSVRLGVSGNTNNDRPRFFAIIGKPQHNTTLQVYVDGVSGPIALCSKNMDSTTALVNFPDLIAYNEQNTVIADSSDFVDYWMSFNKETFVLAFGRGSTVGENLGFAIRAPKRIQQSHIADPNYFVLGAEASSTDEAHTEINMPNPEWTTVWVDTISPTISTTLWKFDEDNWKLNQSGSAIIKVKPDSTCSAVQVGISDILPTAGTKFEFAPLFVELPTEKRPSGSAPEIHRTTNPNDKSTRTRIAPDGTNSFAQTAGISRVDLTNCTLQTGQTNTFWISYDAPNKLLQVGKGNTIGGNIGFVYQLSDTTLIPNARYYAIKLAGGSAILDSIEAQNSIAQSPFGANGSSYSTQNANGSYTTWLNDWKLQNSPNATKISFKASNQNSLKIAFASPEGVKNQTPEYVITITRGATTTEGKTVIEKRLSTGALTTLFDSSAGPAINPACAGLSTATSGTQDYWLLYGNGIFSFGWGTDSNAVATTGFVYAENQRQVLSTLASYSFSSTDTTLALSDIATGAQSALDLACTATQEAVFGNNVTQSNISRLLDTVQSLTNPLPTDATQRAAVVNRINTLLSSLASASELIVETQRPLIAAWCSTLDTAVYTSARDVATKFSVVETADTKATLLLSRLDAIIRDATSDSMRSAQQSSFLRRLFVARLKKLGVDSKTIDSSVLSSRMTDIKTLIDTIKQVLSVEEQSQALADLTTIYTAKSSSLQTYLNAANTLTTVQEYLNQMNVIADGIGNGIITMRDGSGGTPNDYELFVKALQDIVDDVALLTPDERSYTTSLIDGILSKIPKSGDARSALTKQSFSGFTRFITNLSAMRSKVAPNSALDINALIAQYAYEVGILTTASSGERARFFDKLSMLTKSAEVVSATSLTNLSIIKDTLNSQTLLAGLSTAEQATRMTLVNALDAYIRTQNAVPTASRGVAGLSTTASAADTLTAITEMKYADQPAALLALGARLYTRQQSGNSETIAITEPADYQTFTNLVKELIARRDMFDTETLKTLGSVIQQAAITSKFKNIQPSMLSLSRMRTSPITLTEQVETLRNDLTMINGLVSTASRRSEFFDRIKSLTLTFSQAQTYIATNTDLTNLKALCANVRDPQHALALVMTEDEEGAFTAFTSSVDTFISKIQASTKTAAETIAAIKEMSYAEQPAALATLTDRFLAKHQQVPTETLIIETRDYQSFTTLTAELVSRRDMLSVQGRQTLASLLQKASTIPGFSATTPLLSALSVTLDTNVTFVEQRTTVAADLEVIRLLTATDPRRIAFFGRIKSLTNLFTTAADQKQDIGATGDDLAALTTLCTNVLTPTNPLAFAMSPDEKDLFNAFSNALKGLVTDLRSATSVQTVFNALATMTDQTLYTQTLLNLAQSLRSIGNPNAPYPKLTALTPTELSANPNPLQVLANIISAECDNRDILTDVQRRTLATASQYAYWIPNMDAASKAKLSTVYSVATTPLTTSAKIAILTRKVTDAQNSVLMMTADSPARQSFFDSLKRFSETTDWTTLVKQDTDALNTMLATLNAPNAMLDPIEDFIVQSLIRQQSVIQQIGLGAVDTSSVANYCTYLKNLDDHDSFIGGLVDLVSALTKPASSKYPTLITTVVGSDYPAITQLIQTEVQYRNFLNSQHIASLKEAIKAAKDDIRFRAAGQQATLTQALNDIDIPLSLDECITNYGQRATTTLTLDPYSIQRQQFFLWLQAFEKSALLTGGTSTQIARAQSAIATPLNTPAAQAKLSKTEKAYVSSFTKKLTELAAKALTIIDTSSLTTLLKSLQTIPDRATSAQALLDIGKSFAGITNSPYIALTSIASDDDKKNFVSLLSAAADQRDLYTSEQCKNISFAASYARGSGQFGLYHATLTAISTTVVTPFDIGTKITTYSNAINAQTNNVINLLPEDPLRRSFFAGISQLAGNLNQLVASQTYSTKLTLAQAKQLNDSLVKPLLALNQALTDGETAAINQIQSSTTALLSAFIGGTPGTLLYELLLLTTMLDTSATASTPPLDAYLSGLQTIITNLEQKSLTASDTERKTLLDRIELLLNTREGLSANQCNTIMRLLNSAQSASVFTASDRNRINTLLQTDITTPRQLSDLIPLYTQAAQGLASLPQTDIYKYLYVQSLATIINPTQTYTVTLIATIRTQLITPVLTGAYTSDAIAQARTIDTFLSTKLKALQSASAVLASLDTVTNAELYISNLKDLALQGLATPGTFSTQAEADTYMTIIRPLIADRPFITNGATSVMTNLLTIAQTVQRIASTPPTAATGTTSSTITPFNRYASELSTMVATVQQPRSLGEVLQSIANKLSSYNNIQQSNDRIRYFSHLTLLLGQLQSTTPASVPSEVATLTTAIGSFIGVGGTRWATDAEKGQLMLIQKELDRMKRGGGTVAASSVSATGSAPSLSQIILQGGAALSTSTTPGVATQSTYKPVTRRTMR